MYHTPQSMKEEVDHLGDSQLTIKTGERFYFRGKEGATLDVRITQTEKLSIRQAKSIGANIEI